MEFLRNCVNSHINAKDLVQDNLTSFKISRASSLNSEVKPSPLDDDTEELLPS